MDARPYTFSYAELKTATENFSPSNKLGEGGFGPVYKASHILFRYINLLNGSASSSALHNVINNSIHPILASVTSLMPHVVIS